MILAPGLRLKVKKRKTHNASGPHYLKARAAADKLKKKNSTTQLLCRVGRSAVVLCEVGS
jgi:hypothetical protein